MFSRRSTRGFTLVEVMVASVVLALIFAGAYSASRQIAGITNEARSRVRATAVLQERMEEVRALSFDQLNTRLADASANTGTVTDPTVPGVTFAWTRVRNYPISGVTSLVRVDVRVQWTELGRTQALAHATYFSRHGISNKVTR